MGGKQAQRKHDRSGHLREGADAGAQRPVRGQLVYERLAVHEEWERLHRRTPKLLRRQHLRRTHSRCGVSI